MRASLGLLAALAGLTSCDATCKDPNKPPSFSADVLPIVEQHCVPCHSATPTVPVAQRGNPPVDSNFDQYAEAKGYANEAATAVQSNIMPPPSRNDVLSAADKTTIAQWASCGAAP